METDLTMTREQILARIAELESKRKKLRSSLREIHGAQAWFATGDMITNIDSELSSLRQQLIDLEKEQLTPEQFESIRARAKQAPKMGPVA